MKLYPYQLEILRKLKEAHERGDSLVIQSPFRAGMATVRKSMALWLQTFGRTPRPVSWHAHRATLKSKWSAL